MVQRENGSELLNDSFGEVMQMIGKGVRSYFLKLNKKLSRVRTCGRCGADCLSSGGDAQTVTSKKRICAASLGSTF